MRPQNLKAELHFGEKEEIRNFNLMCQAYSSQKEGIWKSNYNEIQGDDAFHICLFD